MLTHIVLFSFKDALPASERTPVLAQISDAAAQLIAVDLQD